MAGFVFVLVEIGIVVIVWVVVGIIAEVVINVVVCCWAVIIKVGPVEVQIVFIPADTPEFVAWTNEVGLF